MAKKLIRLYEQDTTDFSNNGLKILSPTSAKITRNLIEYTYQLELTHLLDEKGMMLTEERILGYNSSQICKVLKGKRAQAYGYKWKYAKDYYK